MDSEGMEALLIGESSRSFAHISRRLEQAGCQCSFAGSYEEAEKLLQKKLFSLVLSVSLPQDGALAMLVERLAATGATFFYAYPVEDGCWWLPALRRGERCFGRPALRPSEFASELDAFIKELGSEKPPASEPVISVVVLPEQPSARTKTEPGLRSRSKAAG